MNNETLLEFTPAAISHIKTVLANHTQNAGFRLSVKQTGCSGYMYMPSIVDHAIEDDVVMHLQENDITIYIDPNCVDLIRGTKVDYVQKNLGMQQLEFQNPNAESLCGCGESFNLKGKTDD